MIEQQKDSPPFVKTMSIDLGFTDLRFDHVRKSQENRRFRREMKAFEKH
jgi:hypothetical protein